MDIVYILGNGSKFNNDEIRYSLRSLEKFVNFDRVFIVGECPKFLKNVIHIPFGDSKKSEFKERKYFTEKKATSKKEDK